MDKFYTLEKIKDAFETTVNKELSEDFRDMAWELFGEFQKELEHG